MGNAHLTENSLQNDSYVKLTYSELQNDIPIPIEFLLSHKKNSPIGSIGLISKKKASKTN